MNNSNPKKSIRGLFQMGLGLEVLFLLVLLFLTLSGGFTAEKVVSLCFMLAPGKTFYIGFFLYSLVQSEDSTIKPFSQGFTSLLRNVLVGHAVLALILLVLVAIGGILPFLTFQIALFLVEILFILFLTLTLPTLLASKPSVDFQIDTLFQETDLPSPPVEYTDKEKAQYFLKTGQTGKALLSLESHFKRLNQLPELDTILLLSGELASLETEIKRGQITVNETRSQMNRIRHSVLSLAS